MQATKGGITTPVTVGYSPDAYAITNLSSVLKQRSVLQIVGAHSTLLSAQSPHIWVCPTPSGFLELISSSLYPISSLSVRVCDKHKAISM